MRTSFAKATLFLPLLCLLAGLTFLVQAQTEDPESQMEVLDTSEVGEVEFSTEVQEISISENEIYIRTKDGKKIILGGEKGTEEIIVEDGRIKIGDVEIDLVGLEGLEGLEGLRALEGLKELKNLKKIPPIRIPRVEVSPRVYTSQDVVKFGRDVVVEENEEIDGDAVAIGSNIEVRGLVTGNAVAIGGDVDIFTDGIVEGDAVSIGGTVIKRGNASVQGENVSISFLPRPFPVPPFGFTPFHPPAWSFFFRILRILFVLFVGIVVISVFPRNVEKIKEKTKKEFLKSGLVGFVAEILALPVFVLLIITVIGIPIALLIEPLFILAALILGYIGVCLFIGEKLQEHTTLKSETKIMILVIGILAVEVVPLAARAMRMFGDIFSPFAWILTFVGILIVYVVVTVGFGASILTRLGTRPKELKATPVTVDANKSDGDKKSSG